MVKLMHDFKLIHNVRNKLIFRMLVPTCLIEYLLKLDFTEGIITYYLTN